VFCEKNYNTFTTTKPEKSNGITDRNIPSVIIPTDLFRRQNRRYIPTDLFRRQNRRYIPMDIFRWYIPTEYTVRLEIRNGMVTSGDFTDGHYRGIQTEIVVQ
jgi:hypothetical protein